MPRQKSSYLGRQVVPHPKQVLLLRASRPHPETHGAPRRRCRLLNQAAACTAPPGSSIEQYRHHGLVPGVWHLGSPRGPAHCGGEVQADVVLGVVHHLTHHAQHRLLLHT